MKSEFLKFATRSVFILAISLLGVLVSTLIVYAFAVEPASKDSLDETFAVEGYAERKVDPDTASITIGTYERGTDASNLQEAASQKVNKVISELKELGINEESIQTSNYSIGTVTDPNTFEVTSHYINVELTVTLSNVKVEDKQVSNVIDVAVTNGLNEVRSLYFFVKNEDEIMKELEIEAIENAKDSAKSKADAIGIKLGKIKNVQNYAYTPFFSRYDVSELAVDAEISKATQIQPGQVELSSSVTLVYEIK